MVQRYAVRINYCVLDLQVFLLQHFDSGIEWLIVKGIADYAHGSCAQQNAKRWRRCAGVMAASFVMHILSNLTVFRSWPHYKGNCD